MLVNRILAPYCFAMCLVRRNFCAEWCWKGCCMDKLDLSDRYWVMIAVAAPSTRMYKAGATSEWSWPVSITITLSARKSSLPLSTESWLFA